jgi:hypothetical protein
MSKTAERVRAREKQPEPTPPVTKKKAKPAPEPELVEVPDLGDSPSYFIPEDERS